MNDEIFNSNDGNERPEPYKASSQSPGWSDGLARQVIVEAIYGDLIKTLPGAFSADLFEDGPRRRIAKIIEKYVEENNSRPPENYLDTLIERGIEDRPEAEQEAIAEEWANISNSEAAENAAPIYREVREYIEFQQTAALIERASEVLTSDGPEAARKILERIAPIGGQQAGRLTITDAVDMLREPDRPTKWLLRPLLPTKTLTLMTSYTGEGKTTFLYPMSTAVATGGRFLGMTAAQTNVMILAVEEDRDTVIRRLKRFAPVGMRRGQLFVHATNLTASEQTYADIRRVIEQNNIGLLLVDTLAQFWTVAEENNNSEVALAMRSFEQIAHTVGCSVILSHHEGKNPGQRKGRGASSLPGIMDLHLCLSRLDGASKEDTRRLFWVEKRRNEDTPWLTSTITLDGTEWRLLRDTESEEPSDADLIVQAVEKAGPEGMSPAEIGAATGLRGGRFDRAMGDAMPRLADNGKPKRGRRLLIRTNSQEVPSGAKVQIEETADGN